MTKNAALEDYYSKLFPYAYNILGSSEDAKDAIQDVLEKYLSVKNRPVGNVTGYLIKAVINQSINIKKKKRRVTENNIWLPEPVSTERADDHLNRDEIISYSLLVLLEKLTPRERAVFILKEAFDYSHQEIAETINSTIENSRKLLSRARTKLDVPKRISTSNSYLNTPDWLKKYIYTIRKGEVQDLKKMLADDISLAADGGGKVQVVREMTMGVSNVSDLLFHVFKTWQKSQNIQFSEMNHQPALLFYEGGILVNCQIFDVEESNIRHIYSILAPDKLRSIS